MTNDDRARFAEMLLAVYTLYGKDREFSDVVIGLWWGSLEAYDLPAIREGLTRHVKNPDTGKFLPRPSDVIAMLGGTTLDSALLAVQTFEKALSGVGTYMTVAFEDPLIHVVVEEMGGWVALGRITDKDWAFRRTEFLNRYRSYKLRGELPAFRPKLIGIIDGENGSRGYEVNDQYLRLVGNPEVVKRTMALGSDGGGRLQVTDGRALAERALKQLESKP